MRRLMLLACAACSDDPLAALPPAGAVDGYLCHPTRDELAALATVSGPGRLAEVSTTADARGYFLLDGLLAGQQRLRVTGADFETELSATVVADTTTRLPDPVCLTLPRGSVAGRICATEAGVGSGTGYWLAGAAVRVGDRATTTDADGRFLLEGVPAGTHMLRVTRGSFAAEIEVVVREGQTTEIDHVCIAPGTRLAVVTGVFDRVEDVLAGLGFTVRECLPSSLAGCPPLDPAGSVTLVEGTSQYYLTDFLNDDVRLAQEDLLFLNCGLADGFLASAPPSTLASIRDFVTGGGSLYVSDLAYEAIRTALPGRLDFWGADGTAAAARAGTVQQPLAASIGDPALAAALGRSSVALVYNKNDWAALAADQASGVTVFLRGDPPLDTNGDDVADTTPAGLPLLVGVPVGAGRIIYTTFHTHQQANADMEAVLRYIIFEL